MFVEFGDICAIAFQSHSEPALAEILMKGSEGNGMQNARFSVELGGRTDKRCRNSRQPVVTRVKFRDLFSKWHESQLELREIRKVSLRVDWVDVVIEHISY